MNEPRFVLVTECVLEEPYYNIVDRKYSWRIINGFEMHPNAESRKDIAEDIVKFLNISYGYKHHDNA